MNNTLKKILYAEDEIDIQLVTLLALEEMGGFSVKVCCSGQEAIEAAEDFQPDLLLLDVMMPGVDGPTAMKTIRELPGMNKTPTIFMTAKVQSSEMAEYVEMGALDVIAKPFDPMILVDQISDIWSKFTRRTVA